MCHQTDADFLTFISTLELLPLAQHNRLTPHNSIMSSATSPQLELLRAKLALAIGPLDVNLAYHEVKASRPDALSEPWSTDMSGPHKLVGELALLTPELDKSKLIRCILVFNNKAFTLIEVPAEQLAFCMARGCPPIDAGENIKLYCTNEFPTS